MSGPGPGARKLAGALHKKTHAALPPLGPIKGGFGPVVSLQQGTNVDTITLQVGGSNTQVVGVEKFNSYDANPGDQAFYNQIRGVPFALGAFTGVPLLVATSGKTTGSIFYYGADGDSAVATDANGNVVWTTAIPNYMSTPAIITQVLPAPYGTPGVVAVVATYALFCVGADVIYILNASTGAVVTTFLASPSYAQVFEGVLWGTLSGEPALYVLLLGGSGPTQSLYAWKWSGMTPTLVGPITPSLQSGYGVLTLMTLTDLSTGDTLPSIGYYYGSGSSWQGRITVYKQTLASTFDSNIGAVATADSNVNGAAQLVFTVGEVYPVTILTGGSSSIGTGVASSSGANWADWMLALHDGVVFVGPAGSNNQGPGWVLGVANVYGNFTQLSATGALPNASWDEVRYVSLTWGVYGNAYAYVEPSTSPPFPTALVDLVTGDNVVLDAEYWLVVAPN